MHAQLLDIALVLAASLRYRAYELCAVVDWLPFIERAHAAKRKVRLFSGVVESIRRIVQRRERPAAISSLPACIVDRRNTSSSHLT